MPTEPNWEPLPNVLASVETAGYIMSKSQLWRLSSAGIVGEPKVESRGRSLGKESHYPPGTAERAIRALSLADVERRLPERAWLIWWFDGGEMSPGARAFLRETARELDHQLGKIRKLVKRNALGDPEAVAQLDEIYVGAETERVDGPFAQARKRIGKSRASSLVQFFLELASGTFTAFPIDALEGSSAAAGQLVEKALGFDHARQTSAAGSEPWLQGDLELDFARLSSILRDISLETQASAADESLDRGREEMRSFQEVIEATAEAARLLLGRGGFGFRLLANAFATAGYRGEVFFLLAWQAMREHDDLRKGMDAILECLPQAQAMREAGRTLAYLRDQVPAYRTLLAPRRISRALRNPEAEARFQHEIAAIRTAYADEIDAALAAYREHSSDLDQTQGKSVKELTPYE